MAKRTTNYIDNTKFYTVLLHYLNEKKECQRLNKELPPIPKYIGECLLLLCRKIADRKNFNGYSYLDEMKADALENCFRYLDKFDPDKSKQPFAYFTQIIWFAFIRRIQEEKKQRYIKIKNLQNYNFEDDYEFADTNNEITNDFIRTYEFSLTKKKKPVKIKGVEKFYEESK